MLYKPSFVLVFRAGTSPQVLLGSHLSLLLRHQTFLLLCQRAGRLRRAKEAKGAVDGGGLDS